MSNTHTKGEAVTSEQGLAVFVDGAMIAETDFTLYGKGDKFANAARLVKGWNLINRLDEMGVSAEEAENSIKAALMMCRPSIDEAQNVDKTLWNSIKKRALTPQKG